MIAVRILEWKFVLTFLDGLPSWHRRVVNLFISNPRVTNVYGLILRTKKVLYEGCQLFTRTEKSTVELSECEYLKNGNIVVRDKIVESWVLYLFNSDQIKIRVLWIQLHSCIQYRSPIQGNTWGCSFTNLLFTFWLSQIQQSRQFRMLIVLANQRQRKESGELLKSWQLFTKTGRSAVKQWNSPSVNPWRT